MASRLVDIPLILMSAFVSIASGQRWQAAERALCAGDPLPRSRMPVYLTMTVAFGAAAAAVIVAVFH